MLRIRLQRLGKKKAATYRIIVSEKHKDTQAGSLEILGNYNPVAKEKVTDLKEDRIKHWLSVGAQPSATVHNLLLKAGILKGKAQDVVTVTKKRQGKLDEKKAAAEEAKKAAEEAKRQAAEEAKAAEEAAKAEAEAAKNAEAEAPATGEEASEEPKTEDAAA